MDSQSNLKMDPSAPLKIAHFLAGLVFWLDEGSFSNLCWLTFSEGFVTVGISFLQLKICGYLRTQLPRGYKLFHVAYQLNRRMAWHMAGLYLWPRSRQAYETAQLAAILLLARDHRYFYFHWETYSGSSRRTGTMDLLPYFEIVRNR
jgi:hypothetical protein